jgi:hypothetical protein
LGDLVVDGMFFGSLEQIGREYVDWIYLVQDRILWEAVVNTILKLRILYRVGNFLTK